MAVSLILNLWKLRRNSLKSVVVLMKWRSDKNSIKKKSPGQCCSGDSCISYFTSVAKGAGIGVSNFMSRRVTGWTKRSDCAWSASRWIGLG